MVQRKVAFQIQGIAARDYPASVFLTQPHRGGQMSMEWRSEVRDAQHRQVILVLR